MIIESGKCLCGYTNSILKSNLNIMQDARLAIPKGMFEDRGFKITKVIVVCQSPTCHKTKRVGVKDD